VADTVVAHADDGLIGDKALRSSHSPELSGHALTSLAEIEPDLGYADWRREVLALTSVNNATYLGWVSRDGRRRVAVLRGSVLSPLGEGRQTPLSWGRADAGSQALAQAVVIDVLGDTASCEACPGDNICPVCAGSGLRGWAIEVAAAFAAEVVAHLPAEAFELSAATVAVWLRRRAGPAAANGAGRLGACHGGAAPMARPARGAGDRLLAAGTDEAGEDGRSLPFGGGAERRPPARRRDAGRY
jgi:hypothetical protein